MSHEPVLPDSDLDLDRPQWVKSIPFLAVHVVALATPFLLHRGQSW